jgi:hypothetical protein
MRTPEEEVEQELSKIRADADETMEKFPKSLSFFSILAEKLVNL